MKNLLVLLSLIILIFSCDSRFHSSETINDGDIWTSKSNGKLITGIIYDTYDNDSVYFEVEYKDGRANGLFKEFYKTGQIKKVGNLLNGNRNGPYNAYSESGNLMAQGSYKDNIKDSLWFLYDFKGNILSEVYYKGNNAKFKYQKVFPRFNNYKPINGFVTGEYTTIYPSKESIDLGYDSEPFVNYDQITIHYDYDLVSSRRWEKIHESYPQDFRSNYKYDSITNLVKYIPKQFIAEDFFKSSRVGKLRMVRGMLLNDLGSCHIFGSGLCDPPWSPKFPLEIRTKNWESLYFSQSGLLGYKQLESGDVIEYEYHSNSQLKSEYFWRNKKEIIIKKCWDKDGNKMDCEKPKPTKTDDELYSERFTELELLSEFSDM
jgi:antitoxin component YwqK of YwqJK toxin-antitoxin module